MRFFGKKSVKFSGWEIRKHNEKGVFSSKKGFRLFQNLLYENGKAENMLAVVGRLF